jgi:hypothetical protein
MQKVVLGSSVEPRLSNRPSEYTNEARVFTWAIYLFISQNNHRTARSSTVRGAEKVTKEAYICTMTEAPRPPQQRNVPTKQFPS